MQFTTEYSNPDTVAQIHQHFDVSAFNANGFAKKPVACPRGHSEDDKKPGCYPTVKGHAYCHKCGESIKIPELVDYFGIIEDKREFAKRRKIACQQPDYGYDWRKDERRDRMARNQIAAMVRDDLATMPRLTDDQYDNLFNECTDVLYLDWRNGDLTLDIQGQQSGAIADWEASFVAHEIAEHDMPDGWRTLMLQVWTEADTAIAEGVAKVFAKCISENTPVSSTQTEWLYTLGAAGFGLPRTSVQRFFEQCPKLTPNREGLGVRNGQRHLDYIKWLKSNIVLSHWKKAYAEVAHVDEAILHGKVFADSIGVNLGHSMTDTDSSALQVANERADSVRNALNKDTVGIGRSSAFPTGWTITKATDYRAAYMRALFEHHGEASTTEWKRRLGVASHNTVNATAKRAGIALTTQKRVRAEVECVQDVFDKQPGERGVSGARILHIEKASGELVDFSDVLNKSAAVEIGDTAVYQPIRKHEISTSQSPAARREADQKEREHFAPDIDEDDITLENNDDQPIPVQDWLTERNNMEEPDGSYRGFDFDPRFLYWQCVYHLKRNGWDVDKDRRIIWYSATGEVELNPAFERLKEIIANDCNPLPPEVDDLVASACSSGLSGSASAGAKSRK